MTSNDPKPTVVTVADIRAVGEQQWSLNSTALKYLRDIHEAPRGTPAVEQVWLWNKDPCDIMTLKRTNGTHYTLEPPLQPWSWRKMLNAFTDDTLRQLVGDGIDNFWIQPLADSYDHKRRHAAHQAANPFPYGAPVPILDFFVKTVGGEVYRFHPSMKQKESRHG